MICDLKSYMGWATHVGYFYVNNVGNCYVHHVGFINVAVMIEMSRNIVSDDVDL